MARPVIATKLYVPRLRRGLVPRQRLRERLRLGDQSRLTLVSAPAGFGKTTLLAEWLAGTPGQDRSVAWVSLDSSDNDPATFWAYVLTALQAALPGVGATALELVASAPSSTEHLLTTLLNELATASGEVWLVLDDYHVIDSREVGAGVAFFLEHLPPRVHVLLSTRADPDLPLARWRVRGELTEIRAVDLRFTSEEAAAYLGEATGVHLSADDVAVLGERTEGWIAALQLAALSIRGREDATGFIARFAGNDRYVLDYLVEEVLLQQPDPVRSFLLQSAVLDRLTGPLCDAVTGRTDGSEMLADLERANLFLVPLDDDRTWYRYHRLFADVLRSRLLSERPEQPAVLHLRASRWFELNDLAEDAVGHALAAGDVVRAAHLMELAVPAIRRDRREGLLFGWLAALPEDLLRRSPVLSVFAGFMLMASGDLEAVETRLDDAERVLAAVAPGSAPPGADTDELRMLPATIAVYRAFLAQARGDEAGMVLHAQHALDLAGPGDHLARGSAFGFLGLAAWVRGDVTTALRTFTQAVASLHAAGTLVDELSSTVVLADMWLVAGRPSKAHRVCERALLLAEATGEPVARATADLHVELSEIDREAGDLAAAREHLAAAAAFVERVPMAESRYRWFVAMARVAEAEGDADRAIDLLNRAEHFYRPGFYPDVRPIAAMRARVWINQGNLTEAADWAAARGVPSTGEVGYLSEFDHLTVVRLLIAQFRVNQRPGEIDRARDLLDRLRGPAEATGRGGSLIEIRMLDALVHDAGGDRPGALARLGLGWTEMLEPEGYVRLFLDEGEPMLALLHAATDEDGAGRHARRVLDLVAPSASASPDQEQRRPSSMSLLSERELQVLRLLDSGLTGPEIAREMFVSPNTLKTHVKHIFTKLDVTNRRAAVLRARAHGVI